MNKANMSLSSWLWSSREEKKIASVLQDEAIGPIVGQCGGLCEGIT